jgi:rsbT co-antagonist protein RsbR
MSLTFAELLGQYREATVRRVAEAVKERAGPTYASVSLDVLIPRMEAVYAALRGAVAQDDPAILEEFVAESVRQRVEERYVLQEIQELISILRETVLELIHAAYREDVEQRVAAMQQLEQLAHGARQQTFHVYLQAYEERMERQRRALAELSTPVVQVYENVLVLPLVGAIDTERARRVMEELLLGITNFQAELVIIDITGVPVVDTSVANHLMQTVKAARLLGAQSILVGISREIAQTLVHLQIDLSAVVTRSNLQAGIEYALEQMGLGIGPGEEGLPAEMMEKAVGEDMGPAHSTDRR